MSSYGLWRIPGGARFFHHPGDFEALGEHVDLICTPPHMYIMYACGRGNAGRAGS